MDIPSPAPGQRCVGVAITIPAPFAAALRAARARFGDTGADQIPPHVTLLPPTLVNLDDGGPIHAHLAAAAASVAAFWLTLRGSATFRPVSPVVFMPVVEGFDDCARLYKKVHAGLLARERPFEFWPHLTLAQDLDDQDLDEVQRVLGAEEIRIRVEQIDLYARLEDQGWTMEQSFALGPLG